MAHKRSRRGLRRQATREAYHQAKLHHQQVAREHSFFDPLSPTKELIFETWQLTTRFTTFVQGEVLRDSYGQGTYQTTVLTRDGLIPFHDLLPTTNLI